MREARAIAADLTPALLPALAPILLLIAVLLSGPPAAAQDAEAAPLPRGPFRVTVELDPSLPNHVVYRPADLQQLGLRKLPIVAWGNGGCSNQGDRYWGFLSELASHGYLVFAGGVAPQLTPTTVAPPTPSASAPGAPAGPPPPAGTLVAGAQNTTGHMWETMDWAISENERADSRYRGRIDSTKVAVAGTSCGGLQAIAAADDPRVTTALVMNSGAIRAPLPGRAGAGTRPVPAYLPARVHDVKRIRIPVLYMIGGPGDQAYPNAEQDFLDIETAPVFHANLPVGHGGTFREPHGGAYGEVTLAWLNWRLKGDAQAARMFTGERCGLCTDSRWTVKRKNLR